MRIGFAPLRWTATLGICLLAIWIGQANGTARAGFETVYDVPPDVAPASIGSNTQLNLAHGGVIGSFFNAGAADGSSTNVEVNIAGGLIGDLFRAFAGSDLHIVGGEFRLDGEPIMGLASPGDMLTASPPDGTVLSGVLADGTPFAFSTLDGDMFPVGTLTLEVTDLPPTGPGVITVPTAVAPQGIRAGQNLTVNAGGVVGDHFSAGAGSTVTISGGQIGANLEAVDAVVSISIGSIGDRFDALGGTEVNISGGSLGALADATDGSEITISGGSVGSNFDAFAGSLVNIEGGFVGERFRAFEGSVINITGGSVGPMFDAFSGSEVNISGGSIGPDIDVLAGSTVNILGSEFALAGVEIAELDIGDSMTIAERNVVLSGLLTDGSPFNFNLNNTNSTGEDYFDSGATLTITRITGGLPGDYNEDGAVNAADYIVWRNHLDTDFALPSRNPNAAGTIGPNDYQFWVENFGNTAGSGSSIPHSALRNPHSTVPEPATVYLTVAALFAMSAGRKRLSPHQAG